MIRKATPDDLDSLEKLAIQFIKESEYQFSYSRKKSREFIWSFLVDKDKVVYVITDLFDTPVGMVAGMLVTPYFSDDLFAQEIVWYIEPDHRGGSNSIRLLKLYEEWAKTNKAKYVQVSNIETLKGSSVSELYKRLGYEKTESAFLKEI